MKDMRIHGVGGAIVIHVFGYERSVAENTSDANWLNCRVDIDVPPFSGVYDASFSTQDFLNFGQEIKVLSDNLSGQAAFETDEGALKLRLTMQARGELIIEGEAAVATAARTTLKFKLQADQSFLGDLRKAAMGVLTEFPVRSVG